MKEQAVLILAHTNVEQVIGLAEILNKCFEIFIHFDKKLTLSDRQKSRMERQNIYFMQYMKVNWGAGSIVETTLQLFRECLKNKYIRYVHIISGQDWPAICPDEIYRYYDDSDKIYMTYQKAEEIKRKGEPLIWWQKYYFFYDIIPRRTWYGKMFHRINLLLQTIFHIDKFKTYHIDFEIYSGSEWMDLPIEAVAYCVDYMTKNKNVYQFFKSGFCSDEFWTQSILCNSEKFKNKIINENHRYILWKKKHGSYPAILDMEDYEGIAESGCHFVRKVDAEISDDLMEKIRVEQFGEKIHDEN